MIRGKKDGISNEEQKENGQSEGREKVRRKKKEEGRY